MKRRFALSIAFLLVLIPVALLLHLLPHLTIYTDHSYATLRTMAFGSCILLMALSRPKWISGRISFLLFVMLFVELVMYFRRAPIDPAGIGEAVDWFLPFWLYINLLNIIIIPTAVILLIYSYVHDEKPYYIIFAATFLELLAFLFPFERICRLGAYALM